MSPLSTLYALNAEALGHIEQALVCVKAAEASKAIDMPLAYWQALRSITVQLAETQGQLEGLTDDVEAHLESSASAPPTDQE